LLIILREQVDNLLEFYVVGVSLGTAWAHPSSGDTVASVMIGGLRTVQNGAFPIHTNDLICIYFDDERDFFEVSVYNGPLVLNFKLRARVLKHTHTHTHTGQWREKIQEDADKRHGRHGYCQGGRLGFAWKA
jgi:hypothetical protein